MQKFGSSEKICGLKIPILYHLHAINMQGTATNLQARLLSHGPNWKAWSMWWAGEEALSPLLDFLFIYYHLPWDLGPFESLI
jgi:hypothetical protein